MVLPVQGWNFSYLMCTTQRLSLIRLFAPLLRATSTEFFRGGCWLCASPSPGASDVILALKHLPTSLKDSLRSNLSLFFPAGPSSCEEERRSATEALSVYVPSCEPGGSFSSTQCQQGGQCWCVDPTGQELPGSRQQGASLDCSECPDAAAALVVLISTSLVEPPPLHSFLCCSSHPQTGVLTAVLLCAAMRSSTCFLLLELHLSRAPRWADVKPPVLPLFRPSGIFCRWRETYFPFCPCWWRSSVVSLAQWAEFCGLCLAPPTVGSRKTCLVGTS